MVAMTVERLIEVPNRKNLLYALFIDINGPGLGFLQGGYCILPQDDSSCVLLKEAGRDKFRYICQYPATYSNEGIVFDVQQRACHDRMRNKVRQSA